MNGLERRVVSLERRRNRSPCAHLSDTGLDAAMRDGFGAWRRDKPDACPVDLRAEVDAFVAAEASP